MVLALTWSRGSWRKLSRPVLKKQGSQRAAPQSRGLDLQVEEIRDRKGQSWLEASGRYSWRSFLQGERTGFRVLAMWPWVDCCPCPSFSFLFCHMRAAVLACLSLGTSFRLETKREIRMLEQTLVTGAAETWRGPLSHPWRPGRASQRRNAQVIGLELG